MTYNPAGIDIEGLVRAAEAATPGPWTVIPPEPYDGDDPELEGSYVYPGGVEDDNGDAVCAFGWAGGSGHMFEAPGNPLFVALARTAVPALLAQRAALVEALNNSRYALVQARVSARDRPERDELTAAITEINGALQLAGVER